MDGPEDEHQIQVEEEVLVDVPEETVRGEFGQVRPKTLPSPYTPSRQEIIEHNITHIPFRAWCPHCVRGKAKCLPHYFKSKKSEDEPTVPVVCMDYAFMSGKSMDSEDSQAKILVIKDTMSKYTFCVPVPKKGRDENEWAVSRVIQALEFLGYSKMILKCDQESSLKAVIEAVKSFRGSSVESGTFERNSDGPILEGTQMMSENSPVKDSRSNGAIERCIQSCEGHIRTLVDALQERLKCKISPEDCVMPWLIMHAGETLSHFTVGADGKVPYQRLRGKKMR